jgi:hypothetical protein
MKKILILLAAFTATTAWAHQAENLGTVNITVLDENGALVPDAPVYIYGENKTHFVGGKDIPGTTTLSMAAGEYRVSSAIVKKNGEYLDRFASHEAHIQVIPGDNTVIVLTLKSLDPGIETLGYTELSKVGVAAEVAHSLN